MHEIYYCIIGKCNLLKIRYVFFLHNKLVYIFESCLIFSCFVYSENLLLSTIDYTFMFSNDRYSIVNLKIFHLFQRMIKYVY